MAKIKPLIAGDKYGRLEIIDPGTKENNYYARVRCECGVEKMTQNCGITSGRVKSCGCYRSNKSRTARMAHKLAMSMIGK